MQESKNIDDIVVSTDSKKIANIAEKREIKVPFLRSNKTSTSKSSIIDALIETIKKSEKYYKKRYQIILLIETTSPLRTYQDIRKSLKKFIEFSYDFLWTISEIDLDFHPHKQLILKKNKIKLYAKKSLKIKQRQQLTPTYRRNGVCYVINRDKFLKIKKLINTNTGFLLLKNYHISIDTLNELNYARKFYKMNFKKFIRI